MHTEVVQPVEQTAQLQFNNQEVESNHSLPNYDLHLRSSETTADSLICNTEQNSENSTAQDNHNTQDDYKPFTNIFLSREESKFFL